MMTLLLIKLLLQQPVVVQQAANWTSIIMVSITTLPATIAAIVGLMSLLQSRRNAEIAANTGAAVKEGNQKTDVIIEKATEIHTLTNSNLSKVQAQLDVANEKIDGFNKARTEDAQRLASMEAMISQLIPTKEHPSPSQINGAKLDALTSMVSDVQHGNPPIPVVDEAVLRKLDEQSAERAKQASNTANTIVEKLDTIQESADAAAKETEKKKE